MGGGEVRNLGVAEGFDHNRDGHATVSASKKKLAEASF